MNTNESPFPSRREVLEMLYHDCKTLDQAFDRTVIYVLGFLFWETFFLSGSALCLIVGAIGTFTLLEGMMFVVGGAFLIVTLAGAGNVALAKLIVGSHIYMYLLPDFVVITAKNMFDSTTDGSNRII